MAVPAGICSRYLRVSQGQPPTLHAEGRGGGDQERNDTGRRTVAGALARFLLKEAGNDVFFFAFLGAPRGPPCVALAAASLPHLTCALRTGPAAGTRGPPRIQTRAPRSADLPSVDVGRSRAAHLQSLCDGRPSMHANTQQDRSPLKRKQLSIVPSTVSSTGGPKRPRVFCGLLVIGTMNPRATLATSGSTVV